MTSLFATPAMPKVTAPTPVAMPDPEDIKARMAKRQAMLDATKRQGRDSTILNPGGASDYTGATLGGGNPR